MRLLRERVVSEGGGLGGGGGGGEGGKEGWSLIRVGFHRGFRAPSVAQGRLRANLSGWSLISVIFRQHDLSSGWSLISVIFHSGGLSSV